MPGNKAVNENRETAIAHVSERLERLISGALTTLELLDDWRYQIETSSAQLENRHAVREYIDFFRAMIGGASVECQRIREELAHSVELAHVNILRQIAGDASDQRSRCVLFRDKWINKPLPYESVRPLLNDISVTTRDQLTAFDELDQLASSLETLTRVEPPAAAEQKRSFDRRALFMRLFRG